MYIHMYTNIVINEVFVEHYRSGDNNGEPFSLVCPTEVEGQGDGTCWICTHKHPVITRPTFPGNAPRTSSSSLYRPQVYQLSNRVIYGHQSPWRVKVAPYLSQMEDSTSLVTYLSAASSGLQIFRCTFVHLRISTNLKSLSTGLSQTYLH